MLRKRILPYRVGSKSAKALSKALRIKRLKLHGRIFRNAKILNWGNHTPQRRIFNSRWINHPHTVTAARCKLHTFNLLADSGVSIPEFTTNPRTALAWLEEKKRVVVRHTTTGQGGAGIEILRGAGTPVPAAPLYVKYQPKQDEYRVHVITTELTYPYSEGGWTHTHVQKKRRKEGIEANEEVRNYHNGWVFCTNNVQPPQDVIDQAIKAVRALGLHFGAVDVIWSVKANKAFVLEVNTAPGLEGKTLEFYSRELSSLFVV